MMLLLGEFMMPDATKKNAHLLALDGAQERLTLFKADLLDEGSFDAAVEGCDGVFHTASPVSDSVTDPQTDLIDPAVKGTLNVLKSCAKVRSIKRVVLTSSFASLPYNGKPLTPDVVVDETWFSDPYVCEQRKLWYQMGKTLAEQAAWKFANDNSIDLVTLHPVVVIGPILQPTLNMSVEVILNLVNGSKDYPDAYCKSVDVRDVVDAHIKAFESLRLLLPEKCGAILNHMIKYQVLKEKAKELGIDFIPLEVSLKDTIESLKEKGFLSI